MKWMVIVRLDTRGFQWDRTWLLPAPMVIWLIFQEWQRAFPPLVVADGRWHRRR